MTSNKPNPEDATDEEKLKAQREADELAFQKEILTSSAQLPNHAVKEFGFSKLEQIQMAELDTIIALAQQSKDKILNLYCLARVGIRYSREVQVTYSVGLGKFVCFVPKVASTSDQTPSTKKSK